jgi:hypothetical protein
MVDVAALTEAGVFPVTVRPAIERPERAQASLFDD